MLARARALLAALWAGELLTVAWLAAPNAFATLDRTQAGLYVGRLFEMDARIALAAGVLLVMMERRLQRDGHTTGSVMSWALVLPLVALFLTVLGYYGLQPLMESAKQGLGSWTFLQLHAASMALFGLRMVAVVVLAWRVMPRAGGARHTDHSV